MDERFFFEFFARYKVNADDCLVQLRLFSDCLSMAKAIAEQKLVNDYDIGIVLANKGLWLGAVANFYGLPIAVVKVTRRGRGATWTPWDEISEKMIKNKRVVIIDDDILSGRSTRRAMKEIQKYRPAYIDILTAWSYARLSVRCYYQLRHKLSLPSMGDMLRNSINFNKYYFMWFRAPEGIILLKKRFKETFVFCMRDINEESFSFLRMITTLKYGRKFSSEKSLLLLDDNLLLPVKHNAPQNARKIMSVEELYAWINQGKDV